MQSKFYRPDEQRAEKVHELFATIARRYDLLNDVMTLGLHRRWKRRLVQLAGCDPVVAGLTPAGERRAPVKGAATWRVLDLCCGTGDIAQLFQHHSALVVGADFTEEMLRVAAGRCSRACQTRPQWVRADALRLPFPDNSFDVVSVGYGLRNLADIEAGLCEILRVLRPGGKFLSLDFGKPESPLLRKLFFAHLRFHLPLMGRWSCGDPDAYSYILASLEAYPAQRGIETLMDTCGYVECGFEEFTGGTMAINFGSKPN